MFSGNFIEVISSFLDVNIFTTLFSISRDLGTNSLCSCYASSLNVLAIKFRFPLTLLCQSMDCFIPGRCSYWDFLKVIGYWKFQKIIVTPFEHLQKLYWFWKFEGCSSKIRRATPIWILKWFWQEIHFFVHLEPSSSGFK